MATKAFSKIAAGLSEALGVARGEAKAARARRFSIMRSVVDDVNDRLVRYRRAEIIPDISPVDDMFVEGHLEDYWSVGRSAIDIVAVAMMSAGKQRVTSILDLPCGGGRVTRHLKAFFPEATLFVGDLDRTKQAFVSETFDAATIDPGPYFSQPASLRFDLIFVGSLLTHFSAELCATAMRWFIDALAPDGLLVVSFHGRRTRHILAGYAGWTPHLAVYDVSGFVFRSDDPTKQDDPLAYGGSISWPSWVLRLVEGESAIRIVSYQEVAWGDNHDVLVVQKRPIP